MIFDAYCTPGTERETILPVDELLRQMDEAGIEKAIIAPQDRELAVANVSGNDRILSIAARHRDRLVPACGVNPWFGTNAVMELERCVEKRARMLVFAPALQGFMPNDEVVEDLVACAAKNRLPMYFHTGPHSSGGPTQVVLLADKHPEAKFVVGHCGSTDHAWDMPAILKHHALKNVWFELSFARPWVLPDYVQFAGSARFVWGSSAPRNCPKFELEQLGHYLPLDRYPDIYGRNLAKLIGEDVD
jgi:predicted TIM-barrel fold metal-dependent hydrolase